MASLFTRLRKSKDNRKNFIFIRTKHSFSVLNIYPYNNGHVLVVPNRQVVELSQLTKAEKEDLFSLMEETKSLLDKVLRPQGYNIGINLGRVAGAGIPEHLHIHIVPRWRGDTNFMPVVGNTKVMSQSLTTLFDKLVHAHKKRIRRARR